MVAPDDTDPAAPFVPAPPQVDSLLRAFVRGTCAYDATRQGRRDFLARARDLVTAEELGRLRESERAHLDWNAVRTRAESVSVDVTGVSLLTTTGTRVTAIVEGIRTTHTTFADVRDFLRLDIQLTYADGWRVDAASGGGL